MKNTKISENILFMCEIVSFILAGFSLGRTEYFFAAIFSLVGLLSAFFIGRMIYRRGQNAIS